MAADTEVVVLSSRYKMCMYFHSFLSVGAKKSLGKLKFQFMVYVSVPYGGLPYNTTITNNNKILQKEH